MEFGAYGFVFIYTKYNYYLKISKLAFSSLQNIVSLLFSIHLIMNLYSFSIFLSSFLLFYIQPLLWKYLLPYFWGIYSVWWSAILFFIIVLLLGYILAHLLLKIKNSIIYWVILTSIVLLSLLQIVFTIWVLYYWINIIPNTEYWEIFQVWITLWTLIWAPYLLLSMSSVNLQFWYSERTWKHPYSLYSISNLGAIFWIITYPFVFEVFFSLEWQFYLFSLFFFIYVLNLSLLLKNKISSQLKTHLDIYIDDTRGMIVQKRHIFLWIYYSFITSYFLIAITHELTQAVASIPLLWIIPLFLYTLSYVIAFSWKNIYEKDIYICINTLLWILLLLIFRDPYTSYLIKFLFFNIFLFSISLSYHYELYNIRPSKNSQLLAYYIFSSLWSIAWVWIIVFIFPLLFSLQIDVFLGLICVIIFWWIFLFRESQMKKIIPYFHTIGVMLTLLTIWMGYYYVDKNIIQTLSSENYRNFYGNLRVMTTENAKYLYNGTILHWFQYLDERNTLPTSYYGHETGIWKILLNYPKLEKQGIEVGVVGLWVWTLAAYCEDEDTYTFYDINPLVIQIAETDFTYLEFCKNTKNILWDARIALQSESNTYDILIIDAFNDDSIPVHLLTLEAFNLYLTQMHHDGILAIHISNRHIDLNPVLKRIAEHLWLTFFNYQNERSDDSYWSEWVFLFLDHNILSSYDMISSKDIEDIKDTSLWTDSFHNILPLLK